MVEQIALNCKLYKSTLSFDIGMVLSVGSGGKKRHAHKVHVHGFFARDGMSVILFFL